MYTKNEWKKQLIFKKRENFENGKKWQLGKGYSLCKMDSLGEKIKLLKTCGKRVLNHIIFDLYKKRMEKTTNIWEIRGFWKLAKMATRERLQPLKNGQFGSTNKIAKNMQKTTLESLNNCSMGKNGSKKQLILEK